MSSKRQYCQVILVGGFHEVIELCELCDKEIIGIIDNKLSNQYCGYEILGGDDTAPKLYEKYKKTSVVITPDAPGIRRKLSIYYSKIGFRFCNLISPKATISRYAKIGQGVTIQSGANISAMVEIGDFVKVNYCANIMHDTYIAKYSTIAPNAVVLGKVRIAEACYIGSNSTILPDIAIGEKTVVGAGAIVTKDVKDSVIVVGNPAREMKK